MDGESLGSMFSLVVIFGSLLGSCLASWPSCSGSMDVIPGIQFRQSAADPRCVPAACVSVNQSERRAWQIMGKVLGKASKRLILVEEDGRRKMGNPKTIKHWTLTSSPSPHERLFLVLLGELLPRLLQLGGLSSSGINRIAVRYHLKVHVPSLS